MRVAGRISDKNQANRFVAFLISVGIKSQLDQDGEHWLIWIEDENRLGECKEHLKNYLESPDAEQFQVKMKAVRNTNDVSQKKSAKIVNMKDRWENKPSNANLYVSPALIIFSLLFTFLTQFADIKLGNTNVLLISTLDCYYHKEEGTPLKAYVQIVSQRITSGLSEVREGQVWRLITPIFMHSSLFHLIFNMMFMFSLSPLVENRMGPWRYLLFVLGSAICSNLLQYYLNGPMFMGMSGVSYALFGYLWLGKKYDFDMPEISETSTLILFAVLILGFILLPGLANFGHLGGFLFGITWVYLAKKIKPSWI